MWEWLCADRVTVLDAHLFQIPIVVRCPYQSDGKQCHQHWLRWHARDKSSIELQSRMNPDVTFFKFMFQKVKRFISLHWSIQTTSRWNEQGLQVAYNKAVAIDYNNLTAKDKCDQKYYYYDLLWRAKTEMISPDLFAPRSISTSIDE